MKKTEQLSLYRRCYDAQPNENESLGSPGTLRDRRVQ